MKYNKGYEQVRLDKFGSSVWESVGVCRDFVGFKGDDNWECPYPHNDALRLKTFPKERPCGLLLGSPFGTCYPCMVLNAHEYVIKHGGRINGAEVV